MRAFVAIHLEHSILLSISGFIKELSSKYRSVRWTRPENLHLTLKFLGEVQDSKAYELADKLREALPRHEVFTLSLKGTGGFPGLDKPRVLWIGIEPSEALQRLYTTVQGVCSAKGFMADDKDFRAHLTIGRVKSTPEADLISTLIKYKNHPWGKGTVNAVALMKSTLRPEGPIYSSIAQIALSLPIDR